MAKFKVGDRVRRIKDEHLGMRVGDTDIVTKVSGSGSVTLKKFVSVDDGGSHAHYNLELVTIPSKTDKELADEYRTTRDRVVEIRKELEERGFKCFYRHRNSTTAQFSYAGTSPALKDVEFRKEVTTQTVV